MALKSALLRFARAVVQQVLSGLTQQLNVVQNEAMSPLRSIVSQVVGGVWIGNGANALVQEVSSLMIPGVGKVGQTINTMQRNINNAINVIDRADAEVNRMVGSLSDVFGNIYR